ncbi:hypothetical protein FACS189430_06080 [Bacteroidia bacterium]|nr:hypothetical protein FACS189430_06080 [Bacteroidia bacterium]
MIIFRLMIEPSWANGNVTFGRYPVFTVSVSVDAFPVFGMPYTGFTAIRGMRGVSSPAWLAGISPFIAYPAHIPANIAKDSRKRLQFAH